MAEQQKFLSPRLTGKRFDDHTIPLELFEDFSVFEELLIELAKYIYFEENVDRKRVPNGFYNEVSLTLAGVSEGSTIPALMLAVATLAGKPNPNLPYFDKAKDRIIKAVDAAENNSDITVHIPGHLLSYFNRIGKGLRDDENIDLSPGSNYRAFLNKTTRKKLVLASPEVNEILYEMVIYATIPEVDKLNHTFTIIFSNGQKVVSETPKEHKKTILEAFSKFESNTKVKITGIGKFNKQDKLIDIQTIRHIAILDPLDITARIEEISHLKDGWYDGQGQSINAGFLIYFKDMFDAHYDDNLPLPYLYPMPDGGIQAEWSNEEYEITTEFSYTGEAFYHCYIKAKKEFDTFEFNFDNPELWKTLNDLLTEKLKNK